MRPELHGERLLALRHLLGVTQEQMATDLGVSGTFISNVVKGQKRFPESLAAAAAMKYQVPPTFFSVAPDPADLGPVTFKKSSRARARDEKRVVQLYTEAARLVRHASQTSGYREASLPVAAEFVGDPEALATAIRKQARLTETESISNMTRTLEKLGVTVVHQLDPMNDHDAAHAGASRPNAWARRPLIALASSLPPAVKRFTIAHELFHLIAHQGLDVAPAKVRDPREKNADRFARALMLPEAAARDEISEGLTLHGYLKLKARFGMNVDALVKRGEDLALISPQRARSLYIQWSSQGWRKSEPVAVLDEVPLLLHQALERSHGRRYLLKAATATGVRVDLIELWAGPAQAVPQGESPGPGATVISLLDRIQRSS